VAVAPLVLAAEDLEARAGLYRNTETGTTVSIVRDKDALRTRGTSLTPLSPLRFALTGGRNIEFDGRGGARMILTNGSSETYEKVPAVSPTSAELGAFEGTYTSDEAEVTISIAVRDGFLVMSRRPDTTIRLTPLYADAFEGSLGTVRFHRNAGGRVNEFSITQDRIWDLRFQRTAGSMQRPLPDGRGSLTR